MKKDEMFIVFLEDDEFGSFLRVVFYGDEQASIKDFSGDLTIVNGKINDKNININILI